MVEAPRSTFPKDLAIVEVVVPDPDAEVLIDGRETSLRGRVRQFHAPGLERGYRYSYKVAVSWNQEGRRMSDARTVTVTPGEITQVDFSRPPSETIVPPMKSPAPLPE